MLQDFIRTAEGRHRYLATPLGSHLDGYLAHLEAQGFKASTAYGHIQDITAFGEHLSAKGVGSASLIDESAIEVFVAHYVSVPRRAGPPRACRRSAEWIGESLRGCLRRFLAYLRDRGVAPPRPTLDERTPYDDVLDEYLSFLREHRGFSETTIEQHRRNARSFFGFTAPQE